MKIKIYEDILLFGDLLILMIGSKPLGTATRFLWENWWREPPSTHGDRRRRRPCWTCTECTCVRDEPISPSDKPHSLHLLDAFRRRTARVPDDEAAAGLAVALQLPALTRHQRRHLVPVVTAFLHRTKLLFSSFPFFCLSKKNTREGEPGGIGIRKQVQRRNGYK